MAGGVLSIVPAVFPERRRVPMATSPGTFSSIPAQADPNALLEAGNEHVWIHASSWRALAASQEGKRIMVEGRGCILKDIDGKEYIDGLAGLWLVNVGIG